MSLEFAARGMQARARRAAVAPAVDVLEPRRPFAAQMFNDGGSFDIIYDTNGTRHLAWFDAAND